MDTPSSSTSDKLKKRVATSPMELLDLKKSTWKNNIKALN